MKSAGSSVGSYEVPLPDAALQAHDWTAFARGYNGVGYAKHRYDVHLEGEYEKAAAGALPDFSVRAVQMYLRFRGFDVGPVDGVLGPHTQSAIVEFQAERGLAQTGEVDDELLGRLTPLEPSGLMDLRPSMSVDGTEL